MTWARFLMKVIDGGVGVGGIKKGMDEEVKKEGGTTAEVGFPRRNWVRIRRKIPFGE